MARARPSSGPARPSTCSPRSARRSARWRAPTACVFLTEKALVGVRDPLGFRPLVLGQAEGQLRARQRDHRARPHRGRVPARGGAGRARGHRRDRLPLASGSSPSSAAAPAPAAASSSTSTSPAPTRCSSASRSTRPAAPSAPGSPRSSRREADLVIPVPDSGVPAAIGYCRASGIPFAMGLVRSHYVGRTFIEPQQSIRHFGVKLKLNAVRGRAAGQAGRGGGRLDRARHHQPQDREDDARRRRARGPPAHQLAAHRLALLLRHRHPHAAGAHRRAPHASRRSRATSPPTRSATCRSRGCTDALGEDREPATATPASPASTCIEFPAQPRRRCRCASSGPDAAPQAPGVTAGRGPQDAR